MILYPLLFYDKLFALARNARTVSLFLTQPPKGILQRKKRGKILLELSGGKVYISFNTGH